MTNRPASREDDNPKIPLSPGDDAAPGTPGTGEDICVVCHGSGRLENGRDCENCGGTGFVTEGIGGG